MIDLQMMREIVCYLWKFYVVHQCITMTCMHVTHTHIMVYVQTMYCHNTRHAGKGAKRDEGDNAICSERTLRRSGPLCTTVPHRIEREYYPLS